MEYELIGKSMPAVEFTFQRGESVYTQRGGMVWMSDGIRMETGVKDGILGGLGRKLRGETFFLSSFYAEEDGAYVAFAPAFPGEIIPVRMGGPVICQKRAFLCATQGIVAKTTFTKKFSVGLFGGEGFILQRVSGNGMLFLEVDGNLHEITLEEGETISVDSGNLVAFEESVSYDIRMMTGKNLLFGGEGIFLTMLTGPGTVYLQTLNFLQMLNSHASTSASQQQNR